MLNIPPPIAQLFDAIKSGDIDKAAALLNSGVSPNSQHFSPLRETSYPLICAVSKMSLDMVKILLEHGADPNITYYEKRCRDEDFVDYTLYTPLLCAVCHCEEQKNWEVGFEIYKQLRLSGARLKGDLDTKNKNSMWTEVFNSAVDCPVFKRAHTTAKHNYENWRQSQRIFSELNEPGHSSRSSKM